MKHDACIPINKPIPMETCLPRRARARARARA